MLSTILAAALTTALSVTMVAASPVSRSAVKGLNQGTTWSLQAWGPKDQITNEEYMVDVDMFGASTTDINSLKKGGHYVVCYIDVGTAEEWRPDYDELKPYCPENSKYSDERWLDVQQWKSFAPLMDDRIKMANDKGCEGLELDNIDEYNQGITPGKSASELKPYEIAYLTHLIETSHNLGLSVGMKNAVGLIPDIGEKFDWALNESCADYNECDLYKPFVKANKAVFGVEYDDKSDDCKMEEEDGIVMKYEKDDEWHNCSN